MVRRGKLTSTIAEAVIHWLSDPSLPAPDFQIYFAPVYFWEHGLRKTGTPALTIGPVLQAPLSRGHVRLRSAEPTDHPRILNNTLSQDAEVDAILAALDLIEELAAREPLAGLIMHVGFRVAFVDERQFGSLNRSAGTDHKAGAGEVDDREQP